MYPVKGISTLQIASLLHTQYSDVACWLLQGAGSEMEIGMWETHGAEFLLLKPLGRRKEAGIE